MDNSQPHVAINRQLINTNIQPQIHKPFPPFSLSSHQNRGSSCCPFVPPILTVPATFPATSGLPDFPLLLAIMPNHLFHSKQPPHLINSSLKWGISQNPNLFYLEFYGCFLYGLCLDDQIDSYCAIFIEFGDVWSYGYLIKSMIFMILHSFICHCRNYGNYRIVPKFWNFYCRCSILFGIFWKTFMNVGCVISELWNFEEICPVLDTNLVIMY